MFDADTQKVSGYIVSKAAGSMQYEGKIYRKWLYFQCCDVFQL